MEKSEAKLDIDIFEENRELKQEIVGLKDEIIKLREEIRTLKEQIQKNSVTSMDKNPSDKMEKQAPKNMESPKVPAWLPDVLDWIKRTELALSSLSTASWAFNQYCWRKLHGKVKPHIVRELTFLHEWDEEGNSRTKLEKDKQVSIPIAFTNPPEYIVGFKEIKFCFLDGQALKFIRSILPLLNDITIQFRGFHDNRKFATISLLMELLAPKTYKLKFPAHANLSNFDEEYPNFLDGIQAISRVTYSDLDAHFLAEWLSMPRDDGKPKILDSYIWHHSAEETKMLIDRIKKKFLDSMEPANFIVYFKWGDRIDLPIFIIL